MIAVSDSPFRIAFVLLILAVNGFFAAAEVSLVSVRPSRLRQMAESGNAGAQAALSLLANSGRLLSMTQVGVTLASLGLGWAGEDTLFQLLFASVRPLLGPTAEHWLRAGAFVVSFLIISYLHVVLGEVVPKNLAIAKADRLAALVAPALLVFYKVSLPFVVVVERSSAAITRALHLTPSAGGHSAEELKFIVSSTSGVGQLPEIQEDMIHRVLDLGAILVREIMTPRNEIVSVSADANLDDIVHTVIERRHSRLPVYEGEPEKIIGILHYKDLLPVWEERRQATRAGRPNRAFRVAGLTRPHIVAPETKPAAQMLDEFLRGPTHMAMVVDEFGTIVGLVTVNDILEQLVGPIKDEHEAKAPRGEAAGKLEVDGAIRVLELESEYGIEIPSDEGFETLAGFLMYRLAAIPQAGQSVEHAGRRFTVLEMDRNRVVRVRIEPLTDPNPQAQA